jgi:phosphopentomutase
VVLLGETDEWAHRRRYDLYLDAAHRADRFIGELWRTAQSLPDFRGRTSLILATDHGRGEGRNWTDHGRDVPAAERIWMAVMGPKTPPLGVRRGYRGTQSQLAATVASLLGEDWQSARPDAAPPIDGSIRER